MGNDVDVKDKDKIASFLAMTDKSNDIERRTFSLRPMVVRSGEGAEESTLLRGYAAVFNEPSEEMWGFIEQIAPGAFGQSIGEDDIRALWNHDSNYVLGRNKAGTLRLWEDEHGLGIEIQLPDAQWAKDLAVSIRRGDVDQMSFGFIVPDEGDRWDMDGEQLRRTLTRVKLFDVSPVTFPAYPQTTVGVRSMVEKMQRPVPGGQEVIRDVDGEIEPQGRLSVKRRRVEVAEKESQ
jgi:uncharacterized protein